MGRRAVWILLASVATWSVLLSGAGPVAFGVTSGGRWGGTEEVPGTAALNVGGNAEVNDVSCASAGDCAAGGFYTDSSGQPQAFLVTERGGRWGHAFEVPGLPALDAGADSAIDSVSCPPGSGDCVAGGYYRSKGVSGTQAVVVSEHNGRWGKAIVVPGTAKLNVGDGAALDLVSCPSAGNCAGVGSYAPNRAGFEVFVVNQRDGRWGTAIEVPGIAKLNAGESPYIGSFSCPSAGNCAAGGSYRDRYGHTQAFIVSERNGRWGTAFEVPGTRALNVDGGASIYSLSCASAGNCAAGGPYRDSTGHAQAFIVTERNGRWGKAAEVPGTANLNTGGSAEVDSVSCPSPGNCVAGGSYAVVTNHTKLIQVFVLSQRNGRWGNAVKLPGLAALNVDGLAYIGQISCAMPGGCAAAGVYRDGDNRWQAFVASQRNGTWGNATEVPGTAALNVGGNAAIYSVSCVAIGYCAAGGWYTDKAGHLQAFVVSRASLQAVAPAARRDGQAPPLSAARTPGSRRRAAGRRG